MSNTDVAFEIIYPLFKEHGRAFCGPDGIVLCFGDSLGKIVFMSSEYLELAIEYDVDFPRLLELMSYKTKSFSMLPDGIVYDGDEHA